MLDDVRFQVARELLASDIALDDIAATLGYSTVTPLCVRSDAGPERRRADGAEWSVGNQAFRFNRLRAHTLPRAIELHPASRSTHQIHSEWLRIATGRAQSGLSRCQSERCQLPMLKWRTPRGPQLRYCAKLALAAVAAYALTLGERSEYSLYSVLGAALVMGGSVGEDLNASLNRVRGTLAGALVGTALAYPLGMSVWSLGIAVAMLAWLSIGLGWGKPALRARIAMAVVGLFTHTSDAAQYGIWRVR